MSKIWPVLFLLVGYAGHADSAEWTPRESSWINAEKRLAQVRLATTKSDVLVVPVQADMPSFDPIERYLMTALIADRIRTGANIAVADSMFVARALGSNRSTYEWQSIQNLADQTGASRVLVSSVRRDSDTEFSLLVSIRDAATGDEIESRRWSGLSYNDLQMPSVSLAPHIDDIAMLASGKNFRAAALVEVDAPFVFDLPDSFDGFKQTASKSPLHLAAALQFLAILHPFGGFDETNSWLFIRSIVELQKLQPDSPRWRLLMARAYGHLGRHQYAARVLGQPSDVYEEALAATLNANLISARRSADSIDSLGIFDFALWRELTMLESAYNKQIERTIVEDFSEQHPNWAAFLFRALQESAFWSNNSAMTSKYGMETLLPADTPTLEGFVETQAIAEKQITEMDVTRLLWRHLAAFDTGETAEWGRLQSLATGVSELDLIELARETVVANLYGTVSNDLHRRHRPDTAVQRLDTFDPILGDHPALTLMRSFAYARLEIDSKLTAAEQVMFGERSSEAGRNGLAWTGQPTADSLGIARNYLAYFPNATDLDIDPFTLVPRMFDVWPRGDACYSIRNFEALLPTDFLKECAENTWVKFRCVRLYIEQEQRDNPATGYDVRRRLFKNFEHRFVGSPLRTEFMVQTSRMGTSESNELAILRAMVESGDSNWQLYFALGRHLFRRGRYIEAQKILLAFPGFHRPDGSVRLTDENHSYSVGAWFFSVGQYELSIPLFEIAASGVSGSAASISSRGVLASFDRDFEAANQTDIDLIKTYGARSSGGTNLLHTLHATGDSETAWRVFDQLQPVTPAPSLWSGAFTGHRAEATTIDDIVEWIMSSTSRRSAMNTNSALGTTISLAARYLMMVEIIDRRVDERLPEFIAQLEDGLELQELPTDPSIPDSRTKAPEFTSEDAPSRFEMIAAAMVSFSDEDYALSKKQFNAAAHFYKLDEFLPYFAFATAKVGDASYLATSLRLREYEFRGLRIYEQTNNSYVGLRFDEDLTYAVIAAFDGRHKNALTRLRNALNDQSVSQTRVMFSYYLIVDLADRFYEEFGDDRYRQLALDLSRRHTVTRPFGAWAYFAVAKFSSDRAERVRATASGVYLDPTSLRGSELPEELRLDAEKHLAQYGPPFLDSEEST